MTIEATHYTEDKESSRIYFHTEEAPSKDDIYFELKSLEGIKHDQSEASYQRDRLNHASYNELIAALPET